MTANEGNGPRRGALSRLVGTRRLVPKRIAARRISRSAAPVDPMRARQNTNQVNTRRRNVGYFPADTVVTIRNVSNSNNLVDETIRQHKSAMKDMTPPERIDYIHSQHLPEEITKELIQHVTYVPFTYAENEERPKSWTNKLRGIVGVNEGGARRRTRRRRTHKMRR